MLAGHQLLAFLLAVAAIVGLGRGAGEVARRVGQPEVLGQFVAGVILGPGVFGAIAPRIQTEVFTGPGTGPALSALSEVGAMLLLLVAGLEVDLRVLRAETRSGSSVALASILPSLALGILAGPLIGVHGSSAFYLGVVLAVTALSVLTNLLLDSGETRRRYAQILVAGGVAAELVAWVLVAVLSESRHGSPVTAALRSTGLAVGFLLAVALIGPRIVATAMRSVADVSVLPRAQLSMVLVLLFAFSAASDALGLHPLLGAFLFGVLLVRAPRTTPALLQRVDNLVVALFAPIFFVLAGTQVEISKVLTWSSAVHIVLLLVLATAAKVLPVALSANLSGVRGAEAWLVGAGANLKGGTDVLVAILGAQIGLLTARTYTEYAVVAILTVLFTPTVLQRLRARAPISGVEADRLEREEAERAAYLPALQRILIPMDDDLRPSLAIEVVDRLIGSLEQQNRLVDVTQLTVGTKTAAVSQAGHGLVALTSTGGTRSNQLRELNPQTSSDVADEVIDASRSYDLLALGAPLDTPTPGAFAPLHNQIIDGSVAPVLVAAGARAELAWHRIRRILVPVNGSDHARAAGELAGHLARSCGARVDLLHVSDPDLAAAIRRRGGRVNGENGPLSELQYLLKPLDIEVHERVIQGADVATAVRRELGRYDLIVLGCRDRARDGLAYYGPVAEALLSQREVPYLLFVVHESATSEPTDD